MTFDVPFTEAQVTGGLTLDRSATNGLYALIANFDSLLAQLNATPASFIITPSGLVSGQNATTKIQAAIDAAFSSGPQGGIVWLPPGVFPCSVIMRPRVQLWGCGEATTLRAVGNTFAVTINDGYRSAFFNLAFDATSVQTSGGAIDFTNAGSNIRGRDLYFNHNLYYGLYMAPAAGSVGIYDFQRLRWNGVSNCREAVRIGDGTHLVTDITLADLSGTAATTADMNSWLTVRNQVDSLTVRDSLFYSGGGGSGAIVIGEPSNPVATHNVTGTVLENVTVDSYLGYGLNVARCRDLQASIFRAQTCTNGFNFGAEVNLLQLLGGFSRNNTQYGGIVQAGAAFWDLLKFHVYDNNQGNTAAPNGIELVGTCLNWSVVGCMIGNGILPTAGHQKTGLLVPVGASDGYRVNLNRFFSNVTAGLTDGGTAPTFGKSVATNITS